MLNTTLENLFDMQQAILDCRLYADYKIIFM